MKLAAIAPRTISFHGSKPEKIAAVSPARVPAANEGNGRREPGRVHLTPREREVLLLLSEGMPNKLIGRELNISSGTVKIHVGKILNELGVTSRLQAVVAAHRRGLVRHPGDTVEERACDTIELPAPVTAFARRLQAA